MHSTMLPTLISILLKSFSVAGSTSFGVEQVYLLEVPLRMPHHGRMPASCVRIIFTKITPVLTTYNFED